MTHEQKARPPGRPPATQESSALMSAAFCMVAFAALVWPAGRMWQQTPRDWEMILPAFLAQGFLAALAVTSIVRYFALRVRAGRPTKAAKTPKVKARKPVQAQPVAVPAQPRLPYPTLDPFDEDPMIAWPDTVDLALEEEEEETEQPFVYPDVPTELGEPFQRIMATIRELPEDATTLADLRRRYAAAMADPRFREAEGFVNAKAERHPGYNIHAYVEPIDQLNPALFIDQADAILPFAATIASMVLVAEDLPEQVWDLLADPWESAGLDFPQVILAG